MSGPTGSEPKREARLRAELAQASEELRAHLASWEYAFAMGSSRHGAGEHPVLWETRERTRKLAQRRAALEAQLAEFDT